MRAGKPTAARLRAQAEGAPLQASPGARGRSPGRRRQSGPPEDNRQSASDGFGAGPEGKSSVLRWVSALLAEQEPLTNSFA